MAENKKLSKKAAHNDTLSEEACKTMSLCESYDEPAPVFEDSLPDYYQMSLNEENEIGQIWDPPEAVHTKSNKEQRPSWKEPQPSKYYCIPQEHRVLPNEAYYLKQHQKGGPINDTLKLHYQEKTKNPKCGWFLFVRFHRNGFDDLKDSLSRTRTSTLRIHGGRVTGIALADQIHVNEGSDDWVLQTKFTRREGTWYRQQYNGKNDMCILVLGFHNFNDLESWIKRDNNFKQHDFPAQYGYEAFAAALNYVPANDKEYPTFLLTEYANVKDSDADAFREYAHNYTKVLERYCPMPYVIKTFGSQHIKGTWIKPKSIVTLSLFPSSRHVQAFFEDDDFKRIRFEQDRLSKTTSIYFTLTEFV